MDFIAIQYYKSAFGELIIGSYDNKLCLCDWRYRKMRTSIDKRIQKALNAEYKEASTPITEATIKQLKAYTAGELDKFTLPLLLVGTDFQKSVWHALLEIPYGETRSYLELSIQLGDKNAIRAVASANGANAISIIVPCHRIIGKNGNLIGYAGGLLAKKRLLELENPQKCTPQLKLF
ncbi:methylated-DNA--[protein]-cysteine S-methyltransferase [Carboxylicivirga sediminis]|nr:methylated-DNA--[protein]-cysteine S-methyltransferase [Carboxylicivirga sediminis]